MGYAIAITIAALFFAIYAENKAHREQIIELRKDLDYQLGGLRGEFSEVKDLLKWIEPHVAGILGHTPIRHTSLKSVDEVVAAVNSGRYKWATVPWNTIATPPT